MDKGYYPKSFNLFPICIYVAIHNKNGQGLLLDAKNYGGAHSKKSQSTIKMDKGYYIQTIIIIII